MFETVRERSREDRPTIEVQPESSDERERRRGERARADRLTQSRAFRAGRLLLGGVLGFTALDNLRNMEERVGYAEAKGAPAPETTVPVMSGSLLLGSLGIAAWRAPRAAATAVAAFLVSVTPMMHDFWAIDDPEQRQQEQTHFLKNTALLGATLALLGVANWADE